MKAFVARVRGATRPGGPEEATRIAQEVEALRGINREISWAVESTGLLSTLRAGLESLDGGWRCRSGELVGVGDVVAICWGSYSDLVVRIMAGTSQQVRCTVLAGGMPVGESLTVSTDQLLLKVSSDPFDRRVVR